MLCRQLEELQGFRAYAAGERAGEDLVVDMAMSGGAGDCTRVGETAQKHECSVKGKGRQDILRTTKEPLPHHY